MVCRPFGLLLAGDEAWMRSYLALVKARIPDPLFRTILGLCPGIRQPYYPGMDSHRWLARLH